jgi:ABC-type Fe3+ transport system substrate-binding protein
MGLDLVQGNCAAGNAHSSAILRVAREDARVGVVTPEADRAYVQLMWVVAGGTQVAALAETAIDAILSPEVQAAFARRGMATPRPDVASRQADEDPAWAATYPTTDRRWRELRYFPYEAYFRHWDHIVKVWDQEILRGG